MISLMLSDILRRAGLNPDKVLLIRHSLNDKDVKKCCDAGKIGEYTQIQKANFAKDYTHWLLFVSGKSTSAKFIGCYAFQKTQPLDKANMSTNFPLPQMYDNPNGTDKQHVLNETDIMADMKDRLIIDWGKGTVNWYQTAANEKEVLSIHAAPQYVFAGYENVVLSYHDLKKIIDDPQVYSEWHVALSSVYAIYLITDTSNGKQYIGSAYKRTGGLLDRWAQYISTGHGDNKKMAEILSRSPQQKENFQFSILQILPKTLSNEEVINIESLFKRKLQTIPFGMNAN